ncbi:MAG TPA: putative collagen-binding domain-containing protein, partial [Kofleriaceae bacterium]|nr:putative collagen-binding domain-containing protein [Kofleriaceae bacterium]
DDALVTAGRVTPNQPALEVIATRTADHKQAVIYMPPGGPAQITVDLTLLSGAVTAICQDPTADHSVAAGDGLTDSVHVFTRPAGNNNGGDNDWVLVLTVP